MKRNFAFISYNHHDVKWAKWLQGRLESYKLPTEIHNEFEDSRYIRPVFRDQTDLNTGVLGNVLRDQLEASQFLIVLCSPNSARSEWVSREVQSFVEWGRIDRIIPVIVDGQPNCYDPNLECFPEYLREYTQTHPEAELLGVSIAEVGKEKAFIRVVSKMLDVSFDTLWQRHERERRRRIIIASVSTPIVLALLYWLILPVSLTVNLRDVADGLPKGETADGYMGTLLIDGTEYKLTNLDTVIAVSDIPGYYRGQSIPVEFTPTTYYLPQTVEAEVGFGLSNEVEMTMKRDAAFAVFSGQVIDGDGHPVANAEVSVDGGKHSAITDNMGKFAIEIPAGEQSMEKDVTIVVGDKKVVLENEIIDKDVTLMI